MSTAEHEQSAEHDEGEEGTSSGGMGFDLWGLGASVLGNVQKNTTTFVNTIVETDWKKELQDIQDGLRTETAELEKDIGIRLGVSQNETTERSAPAETDAEGVSIADIGRRFLTGTAEIFQQVRATVDSEFMNLEQEATTKKSRSSLPRSGREGAKFSRLDMKISAMQRNSATYCDEPDDADAFSAFLAEYDEEARTAQAKDVLSSNPFMSELHSRLVPLVITDDTFWKRYFFRLQKLTQEYEKVQERLQQAHRRASVAETDNEPLDFALSGTLAKSDQSQVASPSAAGDSETPQNGTGTDGTAANDSNESSSQAQQSSVEKQETAPSATAAATASNTGAPAELPASEGGSAQNDDAPVVDDKATRSPAHAASPSDAVQHDESGSYGDGGVKEEQGSASAEVQQRGQMSAVAVGAVGGDGHGEEGNGSARSSGNEKFSSDWSVVSPTANGNGTGTAAGSPLRQDQAQQGVEEPAKPQEAAETPAAEAKAGENGADDSDEQDDEDVDFDDLEEGLDDDDVGGDEAGDGEDDDVDDNWGWE